jgi:hypothetical protein
MRSIDAIPLYETSNDTEEGRCGEICGREAFSVSGK